MERNLNSLKQKVDQIRNEEGIHNPATIIAIAHGNNNEIGTANPGDVDITPEAFLALIVSNMNLGEAPNAIYISTCSNDIAEFTAAVRLTAQANDIWDDTRICGHSDPVAGPVPPPNDERWIEIYPGH